MKKASKKSEPVKPAKTSSKGPVKKNGQVRHSHDEEMSKDIPLDKGEQKQAVANPETFNHPSEPTAATPLGAPTAI